MLSFFHWLHNHYQSLSVQSFTVSVLFPLRCTIKMMCVNTNTALFGINLPKIRTYSKGEKLSYVLTNFFDIFCLLTTTKVYRAVHQDRVSGGDGRMKKCNPKKTRRRRKSLQTEYKMISIVVCNTFSFTYVYVVMHTTTLMILYSVCKLLLLLRGFFRLHFFVRPSPPLTRS